MVELDRRQHDRLLAASPGYAAFYAEAEDDDDREMIRAFAGWLIIPGDDLDPHDTWTAEQFRAEWDFWND